MKSVAQLSKEERSELFMATASAMSLPAAVIEKDFWVCFMLDHLFNSCLYRDSFVFKGGTSLSKSYHVIERFSEDIDLILDWEKLLIPPEDPWDDRSKTKQDQFNKTINERAAEWYKSNLLPQLNKELSFLSDDNELVSLDPQDPMIVNFYYPQIFDTGYLRECVRLEIGPLAEWLPSHETVISSFAAEKFPDVFNEPETTVLTIDAERTFWEKITILHKLSNFPEGKVLPARYARHLYDVYLMGHSFIKDSAFLNKELLEKDILFKEKFYYSKSAHYESATSKTVSLLPPAHIMNELTNDYAAMRNMIYGDYPDFDDILDYLKNLEEEIHNI